MCLVCCLPLKQWTLKLSFSTPFVKQSQYMFVFFDAFQKSWPQLITKQPPYSGSRLPAVCMMHALLLAVIINSKADCGAALFSSGEPLAFPLSTSTYCTQSGIVLAPVQTHTHTHAHTQS